MTRDTRHLERIDWAPNRRRPPDLSRWPFAIPAIVQIIEEGGLDIPAGVTFLVGENGSGKSTLVEALAAKYSRKGFETPQRAGRQAFGSALRAATLVIDEVRDPPRSGARDAHRLWWAHDFDDGLR